jgi:hypothetical protein
LPLVLHRKMSLFHGRGSARAALVGRGRRDVCFAGPEHDIVVGSERPARRLGYVFALSNRPAALYKAGPVQQVPSPLLGRRGNAAGRPPSAARRACSCGACRRSTGVGAPQRLEHRDCDPVISTRYSRIYAPSRLLRPRMKIARKLKIALDETRMLVLGAQILLGFQFRGVFQDLYSQLPSSSRYLNGLALILMVVTLALLILPGTYHRIAEGGNASGRVYALTDKVAAIALIPFAASLGIDVAITGERIFGTAGSIAAGIAIGLLALLFWYGIEAWRKRSTGQAERAMISRQEDTVEQTALHDKIDQMLTEARVILPGSQALLGFQLAIVLTQAFERLPSTLKLVHGVALLFVALSIVLLIAPAAYHRIVYKGEDSEEFHRIGSRFVTSSTIPLALGLGADMFVVGTKIVPSELASAIIAIAVLALLLGFWHGLPWLARSRRSTARLELGRQSP